MLPVKIKRSEIDPNAGMTGHDTGYKRPEQIDADGNEKRLLAERLAEQHRMMDGQSANLALLDRTDKADWPETPCIDDERDFPGSKDV